MSLQQHFHVLSNDFGNLLDSQNFSDFRIVVGKAPNIRIFHAHSQILSARSPYFAVALSIIFITGEISLHKHGVLTILELLVIADELILENFIDPLEDYLIQYHAKEL
ncbi:hypothetical protein G9A89_017997 [Geosiphon pyriformis]|nr:hypothetical protein G9A89_017997 [Geosiphon pyriformis]